MHDIDVTEHKCETVFKDTYRMPTYGYDNLVLIAPWKYV